MTASKEEKVVNLLSISSSLSEKMELRVVLVEPEYEQNIGYCARVMKNFDFNELYLVNPKVELGQETKMYSKHAYDLITNARKVDSLEDAIKECSIVIGTTAIRSFGRDVLRNSITPKQAAKQLHDKKAKVALLIGREGTGLSKEELEKCNIIIRIPSSEVYGTLNISHALAIILYEFRSHGLKDEIDFISENERKIINDSTRRIIKNMKGIKSERTSILAMKRIFFRGIRSSTEGKALINFLKKIEKKIVR